MNELQLSKDINVITAEIQSYKQIAGQSIFEIGRRLKGVRDNPEEYGLDGYQDWENWCEKEVELSRTHANRFIKVAEELEPSGFLNLGIKALYEIATLPEEERKKEHVTSKGETKTPDEMTVRELQELKRQLKQEKEEKKQVEQRLKKARESELNAIKQLEELEDKEAEVIEKEVIKEIDNTDYETIETLKRKIKSMEMTNGEFTQKEKEIKLLKLDASKSVLSTKIKIDEFLQEVAVTSYRRGAIAASSEGTKNKLREGIDDLKNFIKEMEMALDGTIEHQ